MRLFVSKLLCALAVGLCCACGVDDEPEAKISGLDIPPGFPQPTLPNDNPVTPEKTELGRYLFYDTRLSGNGRQSCGSCHQQDKAFSDGLMVAIGSTEQLHPRNSSSLVNVVYNATLTWANPILTELEQQLLIPIFGDDPIELGALGHEEEILRRLRDEPLYQALFASAFPKDEAPIHWDNIIFAISTFVRNLISGDSRFDQFAYLNDPDLLSPAEKRGMELFFSERLECHHCHGGFNFTESAVHVNSRFDAARFHNTGLYNIDGKGAYPANNIGVFAITGRPSDMGQFRAPTLRNVAVTAPYMHDGSIPSLEEVIRFYEAAGRLIADGPYAGDGRQSPMKSGLVAGFTLTEGEREDLVRFLESLTDKAFLENPRFSNPFPSESPLNK